MAKEFRRVPDLALDYTIHLEKSPKIEQLARWWLNIEPLASPPVFLRWGWVSNWIRTYNPRLTVVIVKHHEEPVAIGLFCARHEVRHRILASDQMLLNQTGRQAQDQIWVEYNDFLAAPRHRDLAVKYCIDWLLRRRCLTQEIIISMMHKHRADEITKTGLPYEFIASKPTYQVDLSWIRERNEDHIQSLSRNTRHQVRRALRLYESTYGAIKINQAGCLEEALSFLSAAGELHKQRWHDSGFKNPEFLRFHENLVTSSFDKGEVELLHLTAGEYTIAYLYNLTINKNIYFYLSGIKYEDRRLKPGYVAHCLAIQHYLESGYETYDFMGGENRYKSSLSTSSSELVSLRIWRPQLKFTLESIARKLKQSLLNTTK